MHSTYRGRVAWIDVAKGIAIVLVVLFHSGMYLRLAGLTHGWDRVLDALDTFRMPLFFFMSGLVARRILGQRYLVERPATGGKPFLRVRPVSAEPAPFSTVFRRRMLQLLYLYLLWCVLQTAFATVVQPFGHGIDPVGLRDVLTVPISPNPQLWFIYALPIYYAIAWCCRSLNPLLVLAATAALSAATSWSVTGMDGTPWNKTCRYLFFFLLASYLTDAIRDRAAAVTLRTALLASALYAVVSLPLNVDLGVDARSVPFLVPAASVVAVAVGIAWSVLLSRTCLRRPLTYLGTRTLPVYLMHTFPMITLGAWAVRHAPPIPGVVEIALPPVLAAVAIAIALAINRLLQHTNGILTFPVPAWTRTAPPAAEPPTDRVAAATPPPAR